MALMRWGWKRRPVTKTVVVISHVCPFPTTQGNRRRIRALLEWFKGQDYRVVFVLQPLDIDGPESVKLLRRRVDEVVVVSPPGRVSAIATRLGRMLRGRAREIEAEPGNADGWCWPTTVRAVERVAARYRPSLVLSIYVMFSRCLEKVPASTLRVIDTNEVFFRSQERFGVEGLQAPRVCNEASEKRGLARADVLIAIQRHDAAALRETCPDKRVITVGHACAPAPPRSTTPERGVVLYVGSGNPFNVHGLREFLTHAWKEILDAVPEATLRVVGSCPPIEGHTRVVFRGRVSDDELAREYQRAHVVINPQVAGTGLKIKSVEAINAGCAVVMNPAGAEGLEEGVGTAFLVAQHWNEFAKHVVRLLVDDAHRRSLEERAREFSARAFSSGSVFTELEQVLSVRPNALLP